MSDSRVGVHLRPAGPPTKATRIRVFLSYSRADKATTDWLRATLADRGVEVFRDVDDTLPGEVWWQRLTDLIASSDTVIFLPDEYLAKNVARETKRHIIFPAKDWHHGSGSNLDYQMIGWRGRCEVHDKFTPDDIAAIRKQFPDVVVLAHPECSPEVVDASDYSGSTNAMISYVEHTTAPRYLLLTECSMGDNIAAANPEKEMLRLCSVRCPHMNQITLEDTLASLEKNQHVIEIPEDVRARAARAVERMIAIG